QQEAQFRRLEDVSSFIQQASISNNMPTSNVPWKRSDSDVMMHYAAPVAPDVWGDYRAGLLSQISKLEAEKGAATPELSGLFMKLGLSYQEQGKLQEADNAYSKGLDLLRKQTTQLKAPEPEKK